MGPAMRTTSSVSVASSSQRRTAGGVQRPAVPPLRSARAPYATRSPREDDEIAGSAVSGRPVPAPDRPAAPDPQSGVERGSTPAKGVAYGRSTSGAQLPRLSRGRRLGWGLLRWPGADGASATRSGHGRAGSPRRSAGSRWGSARKHAAAVVGALDAASLIVGFGGCGRVLGRSGLWRFIVDNFGAREGGHARRRRTEDRHRGDA